MDTYVGEMTTLPFRRILINICRKNAENRK